VYAVINGYGASGPRATKPAFDIAVQAESGLMDLTGFSDGRPTKVGISIADEIAGMYLVQGILLALLERQRTDRGQLVEVALHDAMLSMFTFQAQRYLSAGERPERMGNRHPSIAPYETFEAADGTVVVAVGNEVHWHHFCEAIACAHLVERPDFLTNADRVANRGQLENELGSVFKKQTVSYWEQCLGDAGVPCGRVRALKEVLDNERQADRDMIAKIDGDRLLGLGIPVKLSASPGKIRSRPPKLGEHTEAVFGALGHTQEEFVGWRATGVV
jgi:crotonobetainyl-CoA:carnitine CoA-transferase CaiB-like acyl-CoA transferase